jgi:hypothetical protein
VVDGGLSKHGVVLELRLAERGLASGQLYGNGLWWTSGLVAYGVAGDEDQLGLAGAKALKGGLVTQDNLQNVSTSIN